MGADGEMGDSGLVGEGGDSGDGGEAGESAAWGATAAIGARAPAADGRAAGMIGGRGARAATVLVLRAGGDCGVNGALGAFGFAGPPAAASL